MRKLIMLGFVAVALLCFTALDSSVAKESKKSDTTTKVEKSVKSSEAKVKKAVTSMSKVNINTADVEALTQLKGIGEVKAKAIVKYREDIGKFKKLEDILNVPGIGDGIFSKVKPFLTL